MRKQKKTKSQTGAKKLLSTKAGTATSSPHNSTASPTNKIFNTLWCMKKNTYAARAVISNVENRI